MNLRERFRQFEGWLSGWPDDLLTLALIVAALVLLAVALRGSALGKAAALAWVVLP